MTKSPFPGLDPFIEGRRLWEDFHHELISSMLSPSNKRFDSEGWGQYVQKRQAFLFGEANFLELDLLRGGRRMPMKNPWPASPYYVLVSRRDQAPRSLAWPAYSLRPLPIIPVPLLLPDADVLLDMQPLEDAIYTRSRYDRDIDYRRTDLVSLSAEESQWLSETLPNQESCDSKG